MGKFRLGIRRRVMLSFLLLVVASAASAAWSLAQLSDYKSSLEQIYNKELPALMAAYEISRQGESITTAASSLIIAQDKWKRDIFVNRIEDKFNWIDTQLGAIRELGYDGQKINNIKNNKMAMRKSLYNLRLLLNTADASGSSTYLKSPATKSTNGAAAIIRDRISKQLLLNTRLADIMGFSVANLTAGLSGEITRMVIDVRTNVDNGLVQLALYYLVVMALALFVIVYLDVNVGSRVVSIQRAMSAIANGKKGEKIPDSGNDEISDMGVALRTFVKKLEEREELIREAHEEAVKANKAKSDFLAAISHDLRTPLNAIIGFSDIMRLKTFGPLGDPHYEEYATDINKSGEFLLGLINNILDLSKIEAGKHELDETPLDITSLINNSVKMVATMVRNQKLDILTNIEPGLPMLLSDEETTTQILNNLLSNAIKFTSEGGTVTVSARLDKNSSIDVMVADTGYGMSEQDITRALQPFEQIDDVRSCKHKGTGLGLYICVNLMELCGGTLGIESKKDKGTTVTLRFPQERTVYVGGHADPPPDSIDVLDKPQKT